MRVGSVIRFLSQALTVGVAAAIVVLLLLPDSDLKTAVVEIREAASPPPVTKSQDGEQGMGTGSVSYADAVAKAAPAVVNVHTTKVVSGRSNPLPEEPLFRRYYGDAPGTSRRRALETSLGSGVIISPQGYLLTNLHVIDQADEIRVALQDGRTVAAAVVGTDPETDLAVLKVDLQDLPSITLGESENLRVGDVVLAIGNPFGVGQTVTMGIVSATGRNDLGINTFENFIQTDAAINPGNSGGALIDPYGQLVGVNTAIVSRSGGYQGIGFAIPVSLAKGIMKQIIEQGHVSRGWLGVEIRQVPPALVESLGLAGRRGVLVAEVLRDGPANRAGVQPGDVILAIDDRAVQNTRDALNTIAERPPGSTLRLNLVRDGRSQQIRVQVAERPPLEGR
jgi:serine protease DegS